MLEKLELHLIPILRVLNKQDLMQDQAYVQNVCRRNRAIAISALRRDTLRPLVETMEEKLGFWEPSRHRAS